MRGTGSLLANWAKHTDQFTARHHTEHMGAMDTSPHGTRTHTGADMYGPSEGLDSPPRSAPSTAPATPLPSPLEQTEYTYDYYNGEYLRRFTLD